MTHEQSECSVCIYQHLEYDKCPGFRTAKSSVHDPDFIAFEILIGISDFFYANSYLLLGSDNKCSEK